jgi:hypothetical protein
MKEYLVVGVDTPIGFEKSEYLFRSKTKNVRCKYIPQHSTNESDTLIATYLEHKLSEEEIYHAVTEILSSFAFTRNCKMSFYPAPSLRGKNDIHLVHHRCTITRAMPVYEKMNDFIYIPPISSKEQADLVRLYRQANSNNNVYFQILFFWHTLVYPSSDDNDAINYIDNLLKDLPTKISLYRAEINRVEENHILAKKFSTLGRYIKEGARHSIAHIVRKTGFGENLTLDSLKEEKHLWDIATLLKIFSHHRLENEYKINGQHDIDYFTRGD